MLKAGIVILILFILWITEPLWNTSHSSGVTNTEHAVLSGQPESSSAQQNQSGESEEAYNAYRQKFGYKPRVDYTTDTPYAVRDYWKAHFKHPEAIEELRCSPLKPTEKGWMTICDFRSKEEQGHLLLQQATYYIKQGVVTEQ